MKMLRLRRVPGHSDYLPLGLLDHSHTDPCPVYHVLGRPEDRQDDRPCLPPRHCSDWLLLQLELDLRQPHLSISQRRLHPDAQGRCTLLLLSAQQRQQKHFALY